MSNPIISVGRVGAALGKRRALLTLLVGAVFLALPFLGISEYDQRTITLIACYGIIVIGFNISHGWAGELALGQVAVFGAGAYVSAIVGIRYSTDIVLGLVIGAVVAAVIGLLSGAPGVRLGGWSLAMISFFLIAIFPDVIELFPDVTGGHTGLIGIPAPTFFGTTVTPTGLYWLAVAIAVLWLLAMRSFVTGRHGAALRILAESPILARSLGQSVSRTKLRAYLIGSIPAGFAGTIYAYLQQFLSPVAFTIDLLLILLAASIIGGTHATAGAFVGATLLQLGPTQSAAFQKYSILSYGIFMLLGALLLTGALKPYVKKLRARFSLGSDDSVDETAQAEHVDRGRRLEIVKRLQIEGAEIEVSGVNKSFGSHQVLSDVSMTAKPGEVTAIIGPNGSGKTTLLNAISGFVHPDSGAVRLGDEDITGLSAHKVATRGVGRTFQNPIVPEELSVEEVVAASRFMKPYVGPVSSALRLPNYRKAAEADKAAAMDAIDALGLAALADEPASSLPLGTRRMLEVARSVAASPRVILLDEPASGLDEEAIEDLSEAILALRDAGATVVLIEHNFPLVLRIADRINVLVVGQVVASGTPDEIRDHPEVIESYLGKQPVIADDEAEAEVRA